MYDIKRVRSYFPALNREVNGENAIFLDGPGGSQVLQSVIDAMIIYLHQGTSNVGGNFATSQETDEIIEKAREAMAELINVKSNEIAFGQNMTTLALAIARALSKELSAEDRVVVTELDHRANVDPWLEIAREKNAEVAWIRLNDYTLQPDLNLISDNTRILAITHASNGVGTIPDIKPFIQKAREVGAIVIVDAVHSTPHIVLDREELDADIILCSAYKFFGPHVGIAAIREELFNRLQISKVRPAKNSIPNKLETGTQNHEALAAIPHIIEFISSMGEGDNPRHKLVSGMRVIEEYEHELAEYMRKQLRMIPGITLLEWDGPKTPTISFIHEIKTPEEIAIHLGKQGIFVGNGHFYADTIAEVLEIDGWVRMGLAPYTTREEVDRTLDAIRTYL
ncbi:MAG: cysteine desulfurase-like protein [Candidatus Heimdallarchaeota archaeon]|nr:cysteine desulfurase-like protein [Candidatus Heimdallarchaeota archaeon]